MRKMNVTAVVVMLFVLAMFSEVKAETIWSDGFESGNFGAWTSADGNWETLSSSSLAHSGSERASVKGPTSPNGDTLLLSVSSVGRHTLSLNYWFRTTSYELEASDHIFTEWSPNGVDWQVLADYTDTINDVWRSASFILPPSADNNPSLGFRLRAELSSDTDRMYFDDFAISGEPIPEPPSLSILLSCFIFLASRKFK